VLLRVVQPVARAARADDPLQLVGLDPDDLLDAAVAAQREATPRAADTRGRAPWRGR
jgi:hypothetical protein